MNSADNVYDYIVIGSGFGGSVSAYRLSQKGYRVLVLEQGKRFSSNHFPTSDWNLRRYLFIPALRCYGFLKLNFFRPVFVLSGCGVGGGSLVYAATLLTPTSSFFTNIAWGSRNNWEAKLAPFYNTARKMLGATHFNNFSTEDNILYEVACEMGAGYTFKGVETGIYFGDKEKETDPYFKGEGPLRKGCTGCAGCMTGCRQGAKNSLDKNYLFLAEKYGTEIKDLTRAFKIEYDDSIYTVSTKKVGRFVKHRKFRAKGIVVSASVLGTLELLLKQRDKFKTLPLLSSTLGLNVGTNSESLCGVALCSEKVNNGPAITSMFFPDDKTCIQLVKFNDLSGAITHLSGFATEATTPGKRAIKSLVNLVVHPVDFLRHLLNFRWCRNSLVLMVMQNIDSSMPMELKKKYGKMRLRFKNSVKTIPSFISTGQKALYRFARLTKGTPMNCITELMADKATTAHIIGGCPIGSSASEGVVDECFRVHNYPNMYIVDGSVIPCNIGVNPSLTICAIAEYAMSEILPKS
jgi:cholesterol oxidase